jgi:hypothetical protein
MVARTRDRIFEEGISRIEEISENDDIIDETVEQKEIEDERCVCQDDNQVSPVSEASSFEQFAHERTVQITAEIHNEELTVIQIEYQSNETNQQEKGEATF